MKSNFDFLKNYNAQALLEHLYKFEQNLWLDPYASGDALRFAVEAFAAYVLQQNKSIIPKSDDLAGSLEVLSRERKIFDFAISFDYKNNNRLESRFIKKGYLENRAKLFFLTYLRTFGNSFHHNRKENSNDPIYVCNFYHMLDCAKQLHKYLQKHFNINPIKPFNINIVPIVNKSEEYYFEIISENKNDINKLFTSCSHEYNAMYYKGSNTPRYAVLQLFEKENKTMSKKALERCVTTYNENSNNTFGEAIKDIKALSYTVKDDGYYILAYIFKKEPQVMSEKLLQTLNFEERLDICKKIAEIICNLHNGDEVKIYHRLLNFNCIYLCQDIDGAKWYPAVTKLNFAKMDTAYQATALDNDKKETIVAIKNLKLTKYIPEEWFSVASEEGEFIDIYSLGVLFYDILTATFADSIPSPDSPQFKENLVNAGLNNEDIINMMISMLGIMYCRPTAKEVCEILNK